MAREASRGPRCDDSRLRARRRYRAAERRRDGSGAADRSCARRDDADHRRQSGARAYDRALARARVAKRYLTGTKPPVFRRIDAPRAKELESLVPRIAERIGRALERDTDKQSIPLQRSTFLRKIHDMKEVFLIRHAEATYDPKIADAQRPLSGRGLSQAADLANPESRCFSHHV